MGTDDIAKKRILANRKAREDRKIANRSAGNRSVIPRILILTEGESEEIYFQELIDSMSLDTVFIRKSTHTDSVGIINDAIKSAKSEAKNGNEYTYIFCIFDLDTVKNKSFLDLISRYRSKTTEIFPIYSFPCIEVFFCLHFNQFTRPFNATDKKSIGDTVKEYFQQNCDSEYYETNSESIKQLIPKHKGAIYNSQKLITHQNDINSINPISTVHKLLILLQSIVSRKSPYVFERDIEDFIESKI